MNDRLSPRTCLAIIAGLSAVSWVGAAYFIAFSITHLPKGIAL